MKDGQEKYGNQNTRNKVIYRYESSHGKGGMKAMVDLKMLEEKTPILKEICSEKEVFWKNPDKTACGEAMEQIELGMEAQTGAFCTVHYEMFPGNKGEKRNH